MTPKETRLNYKAKKNAYQGDPDNAKVKAEYEAAKKAFDELSDETISDEQNIKLAEEANKKAASDAKKAADKAAKEAKEAADKAAVTKIKPAEADTSSQEEDPTKKNPEQS